MSIGSLQLVRTWGFFVQNEIPSGIQKRNLIQLPKAKPFGREFLGSSPNAWSGKSLGQDGWSSRLWHNVHAFPVGTYDLARIDCLQPRASAVALAYQSKKIAVAAVRELGLALGWALTALRHDHLVTQCGPAVALMAFSIWGLEPAACFLRKVVKKKEDGKWSTSRTLHVTSSYLRPIFLWTGIILICRALDPVVLPSEASHAIKGRFIDFVQSISTVLAFAFCIANLTRQIQKTMLEQQEKENSRSLGVQFIGNTVYTSVWVAAVCLFMELLGFSTQKWITAGGFGTVLLTLAGREIFTNFLSSIMIHATRPFMLNEWIQTKIEGQEVSGTVEQVGWWSPTIVRGDDREAVHIPNHKFTVSVVRNLSRKTHWRIKTHFGISHLDVGKIPDIVSDMRKVISKHPQVEQQRLHRRAFFDNIDPENQALLILVSCFVKTSHFEEYLRVKEIILLELLRVISHHHARLATPIRSVQRIYDESEARHTHFRDASPASDRKRPLYMIEAAAVALNDSEEGDAVKGDTVHRVPDFGKESVVKSVPGKAAQSVEDGSDSKIKTKSKDKSQVVPEVSGKSVGTILPDSAGDDMSDKKGKIKSKENVMAVSEVSSKSAGFGSTDPSVQATSSPKPQLEGLDSMGLNSNDITLLKAAFEKPAVDILERTVESGPYADTPMQGDKVGSKASTDLQKSKAESPTPSVTSETGGQVAPINTTERPKSEQPANDPWRDHLQVTQSTSLTGLPKSETGQCSAKSLEEKPQTLQGPNPVHAASLPLAPVPRLQSVEENLVLGVALDGPKRTLPLDDDDIVLPTKPRELVSSRNGGGNTAPKDRKDPSSSPQPNSSGPTTCENREQER